MPRKTIFLRAVRVAILIFLYMAFSTPAFSAPESADSVLRKADNVRCPADSYFMEVEVSSKAADETVRLEVFTKGREKTRVNTLSPARDRGRNMLMVGEDMWAYVPNLKRAVRVALNQKLTGQAANGDVSRMRWWGDYSAVHEREDKSSWRLLLTASKKGLTYDKLRVWIEKASYRPMRAEYMTAGGMVLKNARFGDYRKIGGALRPTEIFIEDAKNSQDASVIKILRLEEKNSPEAIFNQNSLN